MQRRISNLAVLGTIALSSAVFVLGVFCLPDQLSDSSQAIAPELVRSSSPDMVAAPAVSRVSSEERAQAVELVDFLLERPEVSPDEREQLLHLQKELSLWTFLFRPLTHFSSISHYSFRGTNFETHAN